MLGVDLGFPLLRLASAVLRQGRVRYPRRRVGLVYDRREFPVRLKIIAEEESLPWRVRLHARSAVEYRVHLVVVEKKGAG